MLAERWGISAKTVNLKRNALGIAAFGHFQWTSETTALLGKASDAEVAKQLGISKASVVARRTELGIAPLTGAANRAFDWTDEAIALLGTASDAKVAEQLGLSRLTVYNARVARGIEAAKKALPRHECRSTWSRCTIAEPVAIRAARAGTGLGLAGSTVGSFTDLDAAARLGLAAGGCAAGRHAGLGAVAGLHAAQKVLRFQFSPQGLIGRWLSGGWWPACKALLLALLLCSMTLGRPGFWPRGNGCCWRWPCLCICCWPGTCKAG